MESLVPGRLGFVLVLVFLLPYCYASLENAETSFVDDLVCVDERHARCETLCLKLKMNLDPLPACKLYVRALPRPKMGRACTNKFREGHDFACPLVCAR